MKVKDIVGFLFMLVCFGAFVCYFDLRAARILARQYQSQAYSSVKGEVLSGTVTQWTGSKGTVHYRPSFSYRYQVNGQTYQGRRYRYDGHPSFYKEAEANQVVAAHPNGSEIDVYYNPSNPADAVLSTGLDTADWGIPFTFGAITYLLLSVSIKLGKAIDWPGKASPVAGGVRMIDDRMTIRVRLPRYLAGAMCSSVAVILFLIAGFIIQIVPINSPPITTGLLTLIGISIVSMTVYFWLRRRVESGSQDLVIDEGAQMIELPLTYWRKQKTTLTFADVQSITVDKVMRRRKPGANSLYFVKLELRNGPPQILTALKLDNAESFAA
jgi:hypothetical protein